MQYLQRRDWAVLMRPENMEQLASVAVFVVRRIPPPVAMVCGPLTTGSGVYARNLVRLRFAVWKLCEQGISVFDSTIFEESLRQLARGKTPQERSQYLLQTFYAPLLESRLIRKLYFLPEWESSFGARWERRRASELGLVIEGIPESFFPMPSKPKQ